jgi:hypothetical protein
MTSRVRPAIRALAIASFAILLPIAAHRMWDYVELRRLIGEIEAIQAKGEPVSERQATGGPPSVSETDDAASYYLAGAMLALGSNSYDATAQVLEWLAEPAPDRERIPTLATPLQQLLKNSSDALALADKASPLPFNGLPAGTEYSYRAASIGSLSRLVTARTLGLSLAGDGEAAVDSVLSGLQIRRALRESRWLSGGGEPVAAVLSLTHPSPQALTRLQSALEGEERPEQPLEFFLSDRARYIERIWRRNYGSEPASPRQYTLPMRSITGSVLRPLISHRTVTSLRLWAELIAVTRRTSPDQAQQRKAILAILESSRSEASGLPLGAFSSAVNATPLIIDRSSRVAVAVERFRRDRNRLPGALTDLVPQYLSDIPADPFTGRPLLFQATAGSYTVYSVGMNEKDDGGDLTSDSRGTRVGNRGARIVRGTDVGIRVLTEEAGLQTRPGR